MINLKKPRAIILQHEDSIREQVRNALKDAGWDVTCERTGQEALNRVERQTDNPLALFISDANLPKMKGDDILQKVKSLSPITQRMIMLPFDDSDTLINAINKAKVNACITTPFKDEDLIALSENCLRKFEKSVRKTHLKQVTAHQNEEMTIIAKKLKKKNIGFQKLIKDKKATVLKLRSKKRRLEKKHDQTSNLNLSRLLSQKKIQKKPDAFDNEFQFLTGLVKKQFDTLTQNLGIDLDMVDYQQVLSDLFPAEEGTNANGSSLSESEADPENTIDKASEESFKTAAEEILKRVFLLSLNDGKAEFGQHPKTLASELTEFDSESDENNAVMDEYFALTFSKDQVEAYLSRRPSSTEDSFKPDLMAVLNLLMTKKITYGIVDDEIINAWLSNPKKKQILIARGEPIEPGKDGAIAYHFEIDYTNPGKIDKDGTIDFRERGETPFAKSGDMLATKSPPVKGRSGINIFGAVIPVDEPADPAFGTGPGTELSKNGLGIRAAIDGQPHLDKMGVVSVSPELIIPGDVDFETGNITFQGNIIVRGCVKEGFHVKGISLQAQELEGAIIDVSGDVKVSAGITDSTISAQGNIYAKFISRSKVRGYGNLNILKEIIDSDIIISGKCINTWGYIIASRITSKLGIDAGNVGTASSKPSQLKVGIDEHVQMLEDEINKALERSVSKSNQINEDIIKLEDDDHEFYRKISDKAQIQERAQQDLSEMKTDLEMVRKSGDDVQSKLIQKEVDRLQQTVDDAEEELNIIFETQSEIENRIQKLKKQLTLFEEKNKAFVHEKRALNAFAKKENPVAVVSVSKTITQGTTVTGPNTSIRLKEDRTRCQITETRPEKDVLGLWEMVFTEINL